MLVWALQGTTPAQDRGRIAGRVEDEQGDPVSQARLLTSGDKLHLRKETATDSQGRYQFSGLPAGVYLLQITAPGYAGETRSGIEVASKGVVEVNFQLRPRPTQIAATQETPEEERRNPNIFITQIDLNALRDPLKRHGIDPVFLHFQATENFYGADFRAPLRQLQIVSPDGRHPPFHGSLHEIHQNSALNARPFFNVGPLRPSRRNQFGFEMS
ncbi:MAG: carboxypeptidase-like regulatory domain-containing protein, partial [Acidobacteriota bacterium]